MKPYKIFFVRHGESEGNVNKEVYKDTPDYALKLTDKGKDQANLAGVILSSEIGNHKILVGFDPKKFITNSKVMFYISPFWRTRMTFLEIAKYFPNHILYEDPRLREQEWGQNMETREGYKEKIEDYRDGYGHFYYRFRDGGESCSDVYDRVSDFMNTMHRDFEKEDFPRNVVMVMHGMSIRLFIMRWFHISVEEFETWGNPRNGEIWTMQRNESGKYDLLNPIRTHTIRHPFQFDWEKYPINEPKLKQI